MRTHHPILRPLLGAALILHGLGTAVFALRGADAAGVGAWDPVVTSACVAAVVGFVVAGIGVLRVFPFDRLRVPLALIGAIGAIAAQARVPVGDDLIAGWILSLALPLGVVMLPVAPAEPPRSVTSYLGTALGTVVALWVVAVSCLWPISRTWGATVEDWQRALPGDHSPRASQFEILHAVIIEAPPERVWERLVQLGHDRAGFYSYDWLERAFGADIHNSTDVRAEWQQRAAGDRVFATQPGYLGGLFGDRPGWTVGLVEPNRALILEQWGAFVLVPESGRTKLLVRSTISNERIPVTLAAINWAAFEMPHFIMQRRMLLRIKELAEQASADPASILAANEGAS